MEIKQLYPALSEADLVAAKENLDSYLEFVWELYQESLEPARSPERDLTERERKVPYAGKVDSPQKPPTNT